MAQTKGEYRVGITFNPSNDDMVGKIKRAAADLIDLIGSIEVHEPGMDDADSAWDRTGEIRRLKGLAMTEVESAARWAVAAATKPAKEE
jgi:hypothetical protein